MWPVLTLSRSAVGATGVRRRFSSVLLRPDVSSRLCPALVKSKIELALEVRKGRRRWNERCCALLEVGCRDHTPRIFFKNTPLGWAQGRNQLWFMPRATCVVSLSRSMGPVSTLEALCDLDSSVGQRAGLLRRSTLTLSPIGPTWSTEPGRSFVTTSRESNVHTRL